MAMQSGNATAAVPEKKHGGEAAAGGGRVHNRGQGRGHGHGQGQGFQWWQQQHQQVVMDERDGFISWLRGEFAAANAMIDALCNHLRTIGEPGEYDGVIGCIQQRRCNWGPVLNLQQYYSVAEMAYALQQAGWRRQQQQQRGYGYEGVNKVGREFRRGGGRGHRGGEGVKDSGKDERIGFVAGEAGSSSPSNCKDNGNVNADERVDEEEEKEDVVSDVLQNGSKKGSGQVEENEVGGSGHKVEAADDNCATNSIGACDYENQPTAGQVSHEKQNLTVTPKSFVVDELSDGKMVNVVDGMKMYEDLFDDKDMSKLGTLVTDLRAAGRRGQLQGQTFTLFKRPMRGHGREMIQLGIPVADAPPEDDAGAGTSKDSKNEPIPSSLLDVIDSLLEKQVIRIKPDSCIIDIFNEGEFSHPYMWPQWYGRPITVLFLTECEMTFGKVIGSDHPGDYQGALKLSLAPGSLLVMQGRSSDYCKYAIPSLQKQRIIVTLTKSQPKKISHGDLQRFRSSAAPPPSHWIPPPSRSPNHIRHSTGPNYYGPVLSGVLHAPTARPHLPHPNGVQPIFVPAPVALPMPRPAPVALPPASGGWSAGPARHPTPRLPVPGTGVFLPPGSGNSSSNPSSTSEDTGLEASSVPEKENGHGKSNGNSTSTLGVEDEVKLQDCNGTVDGAAAENEQQSVDSKEVGKLDAEV